MKTPLPARPNLDHLRGQAKSLLAALEDGKAAAARDFIAHLPAAKGLTSAAVRAAGFRLADAQSVVARKSGFASWPALSRHVQDLRGLEGAWQFTALEIDGRTVPAGALTQSRLLFDGDCFRTESPEAIYEGVFTVDVEQTPRHLDIAFVEGPEAGNRCYGVYELDGDRLTLCLGLAGSPRPNGFATAPGRGHALERLRRVSARRPANVTGGTPPPTAPARIISKVDPSAFDLAMTPLLRRLEGEWDPVELSTSGKPMPAQLLSYGSRTAHGNEINVVFGGQTMVHAKVRIDEGVTPLAIDYLNLQGRDAGTVSRGIMEWAGDEVRFLIAPAGDPRPASFAEAAERGTYSRWRRR